MEPDKPEDLHGIHRFEPVSVQPVQTQPTPSHAVAEGEKAKKSE